MFFSVYEVILYHCCSAEITVNKQGYIHASYHVAEMAIFEYYEYSFFLKIFQVLEA